MERPLRALLLAAGLGTRLRPLTLDTPKCLVDVGGELLLERWLRQLEEVGCEAVLINTHYLADQVERFLGTRGRTTMSISTIYEDALLGTAGTLISNRKFFEGSTGLMIHADNAMSESLYGIVSKHKSIKEDKYMTMLTFDTEEPHTCGVVVKDREGVVIGFHEKEPNPPGKCANGAVYVFGSQLIDYLIEMKVHPKDFSTDVIPNIIGKIQSWHTREPFIDIGTPERLEKARQVFGKTMAGGLEV